MSISVDENGKPYKVHLCKTDIGKNSNKFYDMELLEEGAKKFSVKLINGRIGYKGVTNFKQFETLEKAREFFEKKFEEKTHLDWENRNDEPMPGKYVVVELAGKPEVKKEEPEVEPEPVPEKETRGRRRKYEVKEEDIEEPETGKLEENVREFLKKICDEDVHLGMLKQLKFNEEYGKPIDCLSLAQLATGYEILSEIEASCPKPVTRGKKRVTSTSKPSAGSVMHNTNKYYSLIPHSFGFSVPPKIDTLQKVHDERELLDALKGTIEAAQSIKNLKNSKSTKDIYHRLYDKLPCKVEPVSPEISEQIGECLKLRASTHLYKLALKNAFEIVDESDPKPPSKKSKKNEKKQLLWHGTRVTNVFSILMNGLIIPEGVRDDLMFGNGVYFANVPSKSANYCIPKDGGRVFMLLCEVNVQNPLILRESETAAQENMRKAKKGIVYAAGKQTPKEVTEINGVPIFKGGLTNIEEESELLYDEYVVYDSDKFRIKYVVEVETNKLTPEEMMNAMF